MPGLTAKADKSSRVEMRLLLDVSRCAVDPSMMLRAVLKMLLRRYGARAMTYLLEDVPDSGSDNGASPTPTVAGSGNFTGVQGAGL